MLVVDSKVWVDYFNGSENPQTDHLDNIVDKDLILNTTAPEGAVVE